MGKREKPVRQWSFIQIYFDWIEKTANLKDVEKGRLIDAMVLYARSLTNDQGSDEYNELMTGSEKCVFPFFKIQIDDSWNNYLAAVSKEKEISQRRSEAGKWNRKATSVDNSQQESTNVNNCSLYKKEERRNNNHHPPEVPSSGDGDDGDDESQALWEEQRKQDEVFESAVSIGLHMDGRMETEINQLYAEYGYDAMMRALDHCHEYCKENKVSLAYLKKVLEGIRSGNSPNNGRDSDIYRGMEVL